MQDITKLLSENPYPGRGIVLGLCEQASWAVAAYFIMGRSANSRNRVFTQRGDGLITEPADPSKVEDPSLILYAPVRRHKSDTIVTNGDQTDTIVSFLERGQSFEEALRTRTFEPDAPNYTPRISGMLSLGMAGFSYKLSILKSSRGRAASAERFFYEYAQPVAGEGHFIHTYRQDGDPLPSFSGEPVPVAVRGTAEEFGRALWESLHPENKVSLFVRALYLDGKHETQVYNRFKKV